MNQTFIYLDIENFYFKKKRNENSIQIISKSIKILKSVITFPVKIKFNWVSRAQMEKIISSIKRDDIEVFVQKKENIN